MSVPLLIGILSALAVVIILPHSTTAIKCFQCTSEVECGIDHNFRSDFSNKISQFTNEGCTANPGNTPACRYVISNKSFVRERGCDSVGVTSRQPFCRNRYADVVECFCTTDWCNGVDASNTAVTVAEEHFRRLHEANVAAGEPEKKDKSGATSNATLSIFVLASAMVLSLICG